MSTSRINLKWAVHLLSCLAASSVHAGIVFNYTAEYTTAPSLSTDAASLNGADGQIGAWSGTMPASSGSDVTDNATTAFFLANNTATGTKMLMVDRPASEPAIMTANLTGPIDLSVGGILQFTVGSRRTQNGSNAKDYDLIGLDGTGQESFHLRIGTNNSSGERLGVVDGGAPVFDLSATYGGTGSDGGADIDNDGNSGASSTDPDPADLRDITVNLGATGYTITMKRTDNGSEVYTTGEIPYNGPATTVTKIDFDFSGSTNNSNSSGAHFDDIVVDSFEGIIAEQSDTTRILGAQQLVLDWTIPSATATTTYEVVSDNPAVFDPATDIVSQSGDGTTTGSATLDTTGTAGGGLTVTINAIDGGSTIASVHISFETPIPVLSADRTDVFPGEVVIFSWSDAFEHDTLVLANNANADTFDLMSRTDPDTGAGSIALGVVDATYTLTGTRTGSGNETSDVIITVQQAPDLAAAVIPSITDGTVPVDVCWETTSFDTTVSNTLTAFDGATVTDSGTNFGQFLDGSQANLSIVLTNPIVQPDPIGISGVAGSTLTLSADPLDTFRHGETGVIREYEASNDAAQIASGLANDRWADANNPNNTGNNGAAYLRDNLGAAVFRDPVDVADAAVPGITKAYLSGPDVGYASIWEGGQHDGPSGSDFAMEVWFKPNTLVGGQQVLLEWGGATIGSYLALVDTNADIDDLANEIVLHMGLSAADLTLPDSFETPITIDYDINPAVVTSGTIATDVGGTGSVLLDSAADFDTVLTDPDVIYLATLTSGPNTGATAEVQIGEDTVLTMRSSGFGVDVTGESYEIMTATLPWTQVLARFEITKNDTADDKAFLYLNGQLMASLENENIDDAAGSNSGGIGGLTGELATGGPVPSVQSDTFFDGLISIVRFYDNALSEGIVAANYLAITGGTPDAQQLADMQAEVATSAYTLGWTVQADSVTISDGTSTIATITDPAEIGSGCFTTPAAVSTDTTYTVTSSFASGSSMRSTSVTTNGTGTSYEEIIRADGPVAFYRFEEDADSPTVFDYSGNGLNSISYFGTPGLGTPGVIGNSLVLDGLSSVDVPFIFDIFDPDGDGPATTALDADEYEAFSIEALVRPDVASALPNSPIIQQLDQDGTGRALLSLEDTRAAPRTYIGGGINLAEEPVFDASWCHVALTCTYDPFLFTHVLEFFIDGQLAHRELNDVGDPYIQVIPETSLGIYRIGGDKTNAILWLGSLDEVAFYNYDLDDPDGDGDTSDSVLPAHAAAVTANSQIAFLGFGVPDTQGTLDGIVGGGIVVKIKVGSTASSVTINGEAVTPVNGIVETVLDLAPGDHLITVDVDGEQRSAMVTLLPELAITDFMIDPNGTASFTAANGVPGASYDLEYTENLLDWGLVTSVTAPASTILQATDIVGPGGVPKFFYRFREFK